MKEAEQYPANVRCYYWPSGMCREPVFKAFVDDFLIDCVLRRDIEDRIRLNYYDSHVQRCALKKLFTAGVFAIFTEKDFTDIIAMPDPVGIKAIKSKRSTEISKPGLALPSESGTPDFA